MYTKSILSVLSLSLFIVFTGCKKENPNPITYDYAAQINNIANNVIVKTYTSFDEKTSILASSLAALQSNPNDINLTAARDAWKEARIPWESSEGFLFGPVETEGIDPSIDSWPVNTVDLNAVLASSATLDKNYINSLEGTLKGFHTIEWLLFGISGNKTINDFTPREFEYLAGCSAALEDAIHQLYIAWIPSGGNFVNKLVTAGSGSNIYTSQKAALEEIINGIITIADEVGNGKIYDPFSEQNVSKEESRFSANSKIDFANNIRSIKNIWLGDYNAENSLGFSSIIKEKNSTLDTKIRTQIDEAIESILNIPGTFSDAIFNHPAEVQNAQDKVRALQLSLESEVDPIISNL
ncbi:MAG TPA: imelysin family protein [Saprospiraceae bacterium]|nr:imelysin family protein [Saprospiraceae bacterium]